MRKIIFFSIQVAIISAFSFMACSSDEQSSSTDLSSSAKPPSAIKEVLLTKASAESEIELTQDAMAVVKLLGNPSTGYFWRVKQINSSVVRQVQGAADGPEFSFPQEKPIPGAPAIQVLRFVGVSAGKGAIQLSYERPWEKKPVESYRFTVRSRGRFRGVFTTPKATPYKRPPESQVAAPGLPVHFDWREQNAVSGVRDQGQCGSCWAFGTVAAFEAKLKRKHGVEKDLSEQYVVSCNPWGMSCAGGWWGHPLHHMYVPNGESGSGGVNEGDFPYTATQQPCNPPHPHQEQIEGWGYVDGVVDDPWPKLKHSSTTAELKQAIYTHGPIATAICCTNWGSYTGGVWSYSCTPANHIVLITGWDDYDGAFYIKNSWGTSFGESGYIRLAYGISEVGDGATYVDYDKTNPRIVYRGARFYEAPQNDGTIHNSLGLTFLDSGSAQFSVSSGTMSPGTHYTASNLPSGLSMSIRATSSTAAEISISGTASSHLNSNDTKVTLTFRDAAFSGISASGVENSTYQFDLDFYDPYKVIYEDINPDLTCTYYDPWKFFWVVSSDYTNSFGLWYNEGVYEVDPCNKRTYKLETYAKPALSTGTTMPGDLRPLSYGEHIGASSSYWCEGGSYGDQHTVAGPCYSAFNGREAYVGVTLNINGWDVYGWIRLQTASSGQAVTAMDLGYNQDPLGSITAGQKGEQPGPPVPEFTADKTTVGIGEPVQFTDLSTGNPDAWWWSFGSSATPSTSSLQNPRVTWSQAGSYTIGFAAYNAFGMNTLYKNGYITVTDTPQPQPPVADFSANQTNIQVGDSVRFTDLSTNNPTSWSWSFPGGTPSSSSAQNPTVTYETAGTYDVTLTAENSEGRDTMVKNGFITVSDTTPPPPDTYCAASHLYDYAHIIMVELENISNSSGWGANGYSDFTSQSTPLERGMDYVITIECENDHWPDNGVAVWIDWNQNAVFDASERVYAFHGAGPYEGTIIPPSSARTGATRMRVRMAYYGIPPPCGDINYLGEAEDYTINVR